MLIQGSDKAFPVNTQESAMQNFINIFIKQTSEAFIKRNGRGRKVHNQLVHYAFKAPLCKVKKKWASESRMIM